MCVQVCVGACQGSGAGRSGDTSSSLKLRVARYPERPSHTIDYGQILSIIGGVKIKNIIQACYDWISS